MLQDTCTYQEVPETLSDRLAWLADHGEHRPVIVAEHGRAVVGWAALSGFKERSGYRFTAEDSIYLDPAWRGRGIGSRLLAELIARATALGYRSIIAGISGASSFRPSPCTGASASARSGACPRSASVRTLARRRLPAARARPHRLTCSEAVEDGRCGSLRRYGASSETP